MAIEPRGTTRLPESESARHELPEGLQVGWKVYQPRLDLYNLANSATIIARSTYSGPSYGAVNGIQRGRLIKIGMHVDF